jgi:hypothetical protein
MKVGIEASYIEIFILDFPDAGARIIGGARAKAATTRERHRDSDDQREPLLGFAARRREHVDRERDGSAFSRGHCPHADDFARDLFAALVADRHDD